MKVDHQSKFKSLFQDAYHMPWAAWNEVRSLVLKPFYGLLFTLSAIKFHWNCKVYGMPLIQRYRGSQIILGERVWLRSWRSSNPLTPNHRIVFATRTEHAIIKIGDDVGMTGTTLVAASSITIGDRTLVGANSTIVDTDFHPLDPITRQTNPTKGNTSPIIIEEDVFIGMNCLILKGVTIGQGAVIGAGSVVTQNIPAFSIAAGNPTRVLSSGEPEQSYT